MTCRSKGIISNRTVWRDRCKRHQSPQSDTLFADRWTNSKSQTGKSWTPWEGFPLEQLTEASTNDFLSGRWKEGKLLGTGWEIAWPRTTFFEKKKRRRKWKKILLISAHATVEQKDWGWQGLLEKKKLHHTSHILQNYGTGSATDVSDLEEGHFIELETTGMKPFQLNKLWRWCTV